MTTPHALTGLNCPRCGGIVPIPEGQVIVCCPYCDLRSIVKGERGVLRYQAPAAIQRQAAVQAMNAFLSGSWAIARDAAGRAELSETFLAFLPFWSVWGRAAGWAFGEKRVGGKDKRYEPREVRLVENMHWNAPACDTAELGVHTVPLAAKELDPYNPNQLYAQGLVFEPLGSPKEAEQEAEKEFESTLRRKARLDRISQLFIRFLRRRFGLVYYPMWVMRYLYKGRAFQVVVDGCTGKVLYGKAPGNTIYRAAVLIAGMALGAFLAVDGAALGLILSSGDDDGSLGLALFAFLGGLFLMYGAYRAFRYGEEYEYHHDGKKKRSTIPKSVMDDKFKVLESWIDLSN
jgi:DNA-directed RNA polymerase subunit RPC12/RpoP